MKLIDWVWEIIRAVGQLYRIAIWLGQTEGTIFLVIISHGFVTSMKQYL